MESAARAGATLRQEVMEELCCRFILNTPPDELQSFERLCFHIEEAMWFYQDFYQGEMGLPVYQIREFARQLFQACPFLQPHVISVDKIIDMFNDYKSKVPVCGAILLSPDTEKCLLVQGWKSNTWGFPKGKINKEESDLECAIREVNEEIGFDITSKAKEEFMLEVTVRQQKVKLYIVPDVPEDTHFCTKTRYEIGAIRWFGVDQLLTCPPANAYFGKSFFPIMKQLRWRLPRCRRLAHYGQYSDIHYNYRPRYRRIHVHTVHNNSNGNSKPDADTHPDQQNVLPSAADARSPLLPLPLYLPPEPISYHFCTFAFDEAAIMVALCGTS
eukprot:TRINITY_DN18290_c0_g1_i1.p1 TRINITY_DN18290_c0_g1~~TRINITY_DN18290_c0_g1_i1.p1  ORF type:complete len:339 (+),score=86.98 TRINITY_DN18290_c0_g1_i1:33-1019(+)